MSKFFTLLFLSFPLNVLSVQLTGVVTDENNEPIPYVSVVVENTTHGVITNFKGQYYLELAPGAHTIKYSHPEFETIIKSITISTQRMIHNVSMKTSTTNLNAFVITADDEDPAYGIIRNTIKVKRKYQNQFQTFTCSSYVKCAVEKESTKKSDTLTGDEANSKKHHNFIESFSTTHFAAPASYKQIIYAFNDHTEQPRGNSISITIEGPEQPGPPRQLVYNPNLFRQNTSDPGFDFYDNLIDLPTLGTTPFISPISVTAMLSYDYKLIETFPQDSVYIHKILVVPKRSESATFSGYIFIEDSTWAIKAVDFQINPRSLMFFKTFYITQEYGIVNDSIHVLQREEYFYTNKISSERIFGNTIMMHSDYQINVEFPPRFFKNEIKRMDETAYDHDTSFWNNNRPITLRHEEAEFIRYQDSIVTYHKSEDYLNKEDSIYNQVKFWDFIINGVGFRNWTKKRSLYFDPLIAQVRPFGVGGYRHVLPMRYQKEFKKGYAINTSIIPDYGFKNKDLKGSIDTRYTYLPKRFGQIHVKVGDTYNLLNTYESIQATFSRSNYINKKGVTLGHSMEFINGLYVDVDFEYAENHSISDLLLSSWADQLFGELNVPKDFATFNEVYLDLNITYTIKQKYYNEPYKKVIIGSDHPQLSLWYKRGVKDVLGSVVDFDFLELSVSHEKKIGTAGESRWRVLAGSFFRKENVQLTNYKFFRRSDRGFFSDPIRSMQLLQPPSDSTSGFYPGVIATTNSYLQANYIHHFNGALLNKIPLIKWLKLEAVVGGGVLYVQSNNFSHIEAYAGVERKIKLFGGLAKLGAYYVGADSNFSPLDASFKFGINFFDPFNNKWQY